MAEEVASCFYEIRRVDIKDEQTFAWVNCDMVRTGSWKEPISRIYFIPRGGKEHANRVSSAVSSVAKNEPAFQFKTYD